MAKFHNKIKFFDKIKLQLSQPTLQIPLSPLQKCQEMVECFLKDPKWIIFHVPVDPISLKVENYFDVIGYPMDLTTIRAKLEKSKYKSVSAFAFDISLMFGNCYRFNYHDDEIMEGTRELNSIFDDKFKELMPQKKARRQKDRQLRKSQPQLYQLAIDVRKQINQLLVPVGVDDDINEWLEAIEPIISKVQVEIANRQVITTHAEDNCTEHQAAPNDNTMAKGHNELNSLTNIKNECILVEEESPPPNKRSRSDFSGSKLLILDMKHEDRLKLKSEINNLSGIYFNIPFSQFGHYLFFPLLNHLEIFHIFSGDYLHEVAEIIRKYQPTPSTLYSDEIEFDLATANLSTLLELKTLVAQSKPL